MRYRIISVGKIKEAFFLKGINEYLKRLQPYTGIELVDGLEEKTNPRAGQSEINRVLSREGERVLKLVGDDEILVVLDIQGSSISSEAFAGLLEQWNLSGKSRVNLVIGGSHGLSDEVKRRANYRLSFSPMTFPHQMAVLMLTEQLYRGFKILKGEPYHK
ncbi:MAG: 23S rRNA (pseudouridine(1915)-N(3))-methyltransferase RlmH [Syntrophomonadaceae bacterium]|nr:23S rRNA (pseudouridine(1915)-N(3))-methyltransferase RlmH [Syntrophomonadaceae bacterium]